MKSQRFFPIGLKLILGFFLVFIAIVIYSSYIVGLSSDSLEEAVGRGSVFLAEDTIESIDKDVFDKIENLRFFGQLQLIQKFLVESNQDFEELDDVSQYLQNQEQIWQSTTSNETDALVESITTNEVSRVLKETFFDFSEKNYGYRLYEEIFITNKHGANISQTSKISDFSHSEEEWWQKAKSEGAFVEELSADEEHTQSLGLPISVRIDDKNGNFLGVINAVIPIEILVKEAELTIKKYDTTELKLITEDGRLIHDTQAFKFFEDVSQEDFFKFSNDINKEGGFFIESEGGDEKLFAHTHSRGFRSYSGLDWIILISHNTDEIFVANVLLQRTIIIISFVFLSVFVVFATLFSRSLSNPIKKLSEASAAMAGGELEQYIEIKSQDEIGRLAINFNTMSSKLLQSFDKLKELNEVKSKFITVISHQLRTPLSSIRWNLEMLVKGDLGELKEEQKETASLIHVAMSNITERLNDMFMALDIEQGKVSLKKEDADLLALMESVIVESKDQADAKKLEYSYSLLKEKLPLSIDAEKIKDSAKRMIDNAIRYTKEKGTIEISLSKKDEATIIFKVQDTGVGIPEKEQAEIFNRFFRASNAAKQHTDASGVSLSIVKYNVEQHGGKVGFESTEGKGSTFWFELPLK